jgi:autotransporter-associated beta strand protein
LQWTAAGVRQAVAWTAVAGLLLSGPGTAPLAAIDVNWVGNTDVNFNTSSNWNPGTPAAGDVLIFGTAGTAGAVLNNDLTAALSLGGLTFGAGASSYTLNGNGITLGGNIAVNGPSVQTINLNIARTATRNISLVDGASVIFGGIISGAGGGFNLVNSSGSGNATVTLTGAGANTNTGVVTLNSGITLNFNKASALGGSGASLVINGGSLDNTSGALVTAAVGYIQTWNGDWTFIGGSGTTHDLNIGSGAVTLGGAGTTRTVTVNAGTYTTAGAIGGAGMTLAKNGAGTMALQGAINTGSGGLIVNQGILRISAANQNTGETTINGGSLELAGGLGNNLGASPVRMTGGILDGSLIAFSPIVAALSGNQGTVRLGGNMMILGNANSADSFNGAIYSTGGILKTGIGMVTLGGMNQFTNLAVGQGTVKLDFAQAGAPVSDILSGKSLLAMQGGALWSAGAAGTANSQSFAGTTIRPGKSSLLATADAGGSMNVSLGRITRSVGGLVDLASPTSGTFTTSTGNTAFSGGSPTILGGYATIGGTTFAAVDGGGVIGGLASYTAGFSPGADVDAPFSATTPGAMTINSLRYDMPGAYTTTLGGPLSIATGGLLVTPNVAAGDILITGSQLTSGNGQDLIVHQNNGAGLLRIDSAITGGIALTKAGIGTLVLGSGANSYTGGTYLQNGTLVLGNATALPSGGSVIFGGAGTGGTLDLNGQIVTLARLGVADGATGSAQVIGNGNSNTYATLIYNNVSTNTSAGTSTFSGSIVDSLSGGLQTTALRMNAGTLNLTGASSYSGGTQIAGGRLTVAGNASLGADTGGIDFLGTGSLAIMTNGTSLAAGRTINIATGATAFLELPAIASATVAGIVTGDGDLVIDGGLNDGTTPASVTFSSTGQMLSGSLIVNNGLALVSSGNASGAQWQLITGVGLNNGSLTLVNTAAGAGVNRFRDAAMLVVNGGGITFTNTVAANANYLEAFGALTLGSGAFNVVLTNNQTGVNNSQRLSFASFTRSGAASTASFSGTLNNTTSRIEFVGLGPTPAGEIIGPWATTGATAATQTDYTRFDASGNVLAANFASVANDSTWTTAYSAASNINLSGATNLTNTRIINSLRYTGAAATLGLGTNNLQTYGILSAGASLLTIAGTGSVSTPAGGGYLFLIGGSSTATHGITISAPITDNGGAVTPVIGGAGVVTLSGTNTFSGGVVINSGFLTAFNDAALGAAGTPIVFDGSGQLNIGSGTSSTTYNLNRSIVINNGAMPTIRLNYINNASTVTVNVSGPVSGSGGLVMAGTTNDVLNLNSTANTFTGGIYLNTVTTAGGVGLGVASLIDSPTANGSIRFAPGSTGSPIFWLNSSAVQSLALNYRQLDLAGAATAGVGGGGIGNLNADPNVILTVNTDLLVTGAQNKVFSLVGTNMGDNTFNGKIADGNVGGSLVQVALSHSGTGKWIVTGENTYTGGTILARTGITGIGSDSAFSSGYINNTGVGSLQSVGTARTLTNAFLLSANLTTTGALDLTLAGDFTQTGASRTLTNSISTGAKFTLGSADRKLYLSESQSTGRVLTFAGAGRTEIAASIADSIFGVSSANTSGVIVNTATGTVRFGNASTYTGNTTLSAGTILLGSASPFGTSAVAWNGVTVLSELSGGSVLNNSGTLGGNNIFNGTNGIEIAGVLALTGSRTVTNNLVGGLLKLSGTVGLSNSATAYALTLTGPGNTTISGPITNGTGGATATSLAYSGSGVLTLAGANTYGGTTTINNGTVNLTGSHNGAGSFILSPTSVAARTIFNVSGNITALGFTGASLIGSEFIYNQTGGVSTYGTGTTAIGGAAGYGNLNISGGTLTSNSGNFGISFGNSTGVVNVSGDNTVFNATGGYLMLGYSGSQTTYQSHGELNILGGQVNKINASQPLFMNYQNNPSVTNSTYGVLNLAGGHLTATGTSPLRLGITTMNNAVGLVNLAAGSFTTNGILNGTTGGANNTAFVNFAGAKVISAANNTLIPANTATSTVVSTIFGAINNAGTSSDFAGGVTFDTNGFTQTISTVLTGASGYGITQTDLGDLAALAGNAGYVGTPGITFSSVGVSAGGTPASGYAVVNPTTGKVTQIVITSPGTYDAGATPTLTFTGGGGSIGTIALPTVSSANVNSGGVTKTGLGTLIFSAAQTYGGNTKIEAGTLRLAAGGSINQSPTISIGGGGTFDVAAIANYAPASGQKLAAFGSGTATVVGPTATAINLSDRIVDLSDGNQLGTLAFTGNGVLFSGSTLRFDLGATGSDLITIAGATTFLSQGTIDLAVLAGTTSLLTGMQAYTLVTAGGGWDGGAFVLGIPQLMLNDVLYTFGLSGNLTHQYLDVFATPLANNAFWQGSVDGTWAGANWTSDSAGTTATGTPGSNANVTFSATGAMNFNTTLGGDRTINSLNFAAGQTAGVTIGGNTLTLAAAAVNGNPAGSGLTVAAGSGPHVINSNIALGSTQTWDNRSTNSLTVTGNVSGGFGLTLTGGGNFVLAGTNVYQGGTTILGGTTLTLAGNNSGPTGLFSVVDGTLVIGTGGNLPTTAAVTLGGGTTGGKVVLGDASGALGVTLASLTTMGSGMSRVVGGHSTLSTLTMNNAANVAFSGVLGGAGTNENNLSVVKNGLGTFSLSGTNTYVGATTVNAGTFVVQSGGAISSAGGITVGSSGSLLVNSNAGITGNGSINVAGTFVHDGTAAASSIVTVQSGGRMEGSGTAGAIVVASGGELSPGNSVESLNATSLTLDGGAWLYFEFRDVGGVPGSGWDLIDLGTGLFDLGDATASDPIFININAWAADNLSHDSGGEGNNFNPNTSYEWLYIKSSNLNSPTFDVPPDDDFARRFVVVDDAPNAGVFGSGNAFSRPISSLGQGTFNVAYGNYGQGQGLYITYNAIPEPGSLFLASLAAAGAGWYGRRKLKRREETSTVAEAS